LNDVRHILDRTQYEKRNSGVLASDLTAVVRPGRPWQADIENNKIGVRSENDPQGKGIPGDRHDVEAFRFQNLANRFLSSQIITEDQNSLHPSTAVSASRTIGRSRSWLFIMKGMDYSAESVSDLAENDSSFTAQGCQAAVKGLSFVQGKSGQRILPTRANQSKETN
jgi:hypothetical protein